MVVVDRMAWRRWNMSTERVRTQPGLLIFQHVPKTGGTSVREWLLRNGGKLRLPKRLDGMQRYYEAECFFCLCHPTLFPCAAAAVQSCRGAKPRPHSFDARTGDWRNARVAIELHSTSSRHG